MPEARCDADAAPAPLAALSLSLPPGLAEVLDHGPDAADTFADDVLRGLSAASKAVPSRHLHDSIGLRLFNRIRTLPDYYPGSAETGIFNAHRGEIARLIGPDACLVAFGCGTSAQVHPMVEALPRLGGLVAVDAARDPLFDAATALAEAYPRLPVAAVCADVTRPLSLPGIAQRRRRVGFLSGATIGTAEPDETAAMLRTMADGLGTGGALIVGVDLVKDRATLERAYNDRDGLTAAFNLNLLSRINRDLCGSFEPRFFRHRAVWNEDASRVEMHLVSRRRQRVHLAGRAVLFDEDEAIHTANTHKYTMGGFHRLARAAGLRPVQGWTDHNRLFSLHFLAVA